MSLVPRHVLIIGGGLAGPVLALALAHGGIPSTVFELRATRGDSGGSLSLGPNALQVLDRYAGVYDQVRAAGFSYRRFTACTDDGERLGHIVVSAEDSKYPAVRIMRPTLHEILLEAADKTGLVQVRYGATLERIEETETGVTAHFADGISAEGDVLVGADGVHSKVRHHVLGAEAPTPTFDKAIVVNGFLPTSSVKSPSPDFFPAFVFTASGLFMAIPIDAEGQRLAWGINTNVADRPWKEWRELERSGEAARLAKALHKDVATEPIRSLLDNAPDDEAKLWAPSSIPDIPRWHTSRVCLIGDAAHAMPPNGAGTALAFEDAAILTRLLTASATGAEILSYEALFARFEELRRPRVQGIRKSSMGFAVKARTGPLAWYLKKWAFRAFFWWNSGEVKHMGPTEYNVDEVKL